MINATQFFEDFTKEVDNNDEQKWVHPLIFVDFCMWLFPEFKVAVSEVIHDQMLRTRKRQTMSLAEKKLAKQQQNLFASIKNQTKNNWGQSKINTFGRQLLIYVDAGLSETEKLMLL
jgi:hypothetical protein